MILPIGALLLLFAVGWLLWVMGPGPEMKVKLSFFSYTNSPPVIDLGPVLLPNANGQTLFALVQVSNIGPAPVMFIPSIPDTNTVDLPGFAFHYSTSEPTFIKPGGTHLAVVVPQNCLKPWFTTFLVQRQSGLERVFDPMSADRSNITRRVAKGFMRSPPEMWLRFGPITNLPSDVNPDR